MAHYQHTDFPHGIMFHHFTDFVHPRGQGAITADETAAMIEYLDPARILTAQEWVERSLNNTLENHHLCITFDDSLLCQYDVAWPVLKDYRITGFFFVYSSIFEGIAEPLEIYRYFRTVAFDSIDEFYEAFFAEMDKTFPSKRDKALKEANIEDYLKDYPFFTYNDRVFRYLRDEVLSTPEYNKIMDCMINTAGFEPEAISRKLWMTEDQLKDLHSSGNIIGLHSYSHPLTMGRLPAAEQSDEYQKNYNHLTKTLGETPRTMSHPSNSYNNDTLALLGEMGVELGFRADMVKSPQYGILEQPREDHANIFRMMQE